MTRLAARNRVPRKWPQGQSRAENPGAIGTDEAAYTIKPRAFLPEALSLRGFLIVAYDAGIDRLYIREYRIKPL